MDITEAIAQLKQLPTADAIADEFVARGIKDCREHSPSSCAVAKYLRETTGTVTYVGVSFDVTFSTKQLPEGNKAWHYAPVIAQFIRAFDRGDYPKLSG